MAMSRKHYREAAEIIKNALPSRADADTPAGVVRTQTTREIACDLAIMFKQDNSAFDRYKFLDACGL